MHHEFNLAWHHSLLDLALTAAIEHVLRLAEVKGYVKGLRRQVLDRVGVS